MLLSRPLAATVTGVTAAAVAAALVAAAPAASAAPRASIGALAPAAATAATAALQPMPNVPLNSCNDSTLPKSNGTGAPLPGDPFAYGYANATSIGWPGNYWAPITYLSGAYYARGVPVKYNGDCGGMYSFNVYNYGLNGAAPAGGSVQWTEAEGYLPAMQTSFTRNGVAVTITDFASKQTVAGTPTELVYTRITIKNTTNAAVDVPPGATGPNLVTLAQAPDSVPAGATVTDDYVAAVDTFGLTPLPTTAQITQSATSYDVAYEAMKTFWNTQLQSAPSLSLPNIELPGTGLANPGDAMSNAYKAAYIYTLIMQTGQAQFSGANNYNAVLNHDVPSILDGRFTAGNFADAQNLLLTARISENPSYDTNGANWYWDGPWKTPALWADYLRLTNDTSFVSTYFHDDANGSSPWGPSLYTLMHTYFLQQLDPATGFLKFSNDNDSGGTWLFDDESALAGLAGYRYIASRIGNQDEANWATTQYNLLLANVNKGLDANQQAHGFDYLPCEVNQPTSANRCATPNDANWAASNQWSQNAWTIMLQGGDLSGILGNPDQTDNLYSMGFARLKNQGLEFPTFGAYPGYTVALNTAYSNAALYGNQYRSLPLTSYAWQLQNTTGGPNSWWEAVSAPPDPKNPWAGSHTTPQFGASPYVWPMAGQTQSVQQAIVADGPVASSSTGLPTYHTAVYVGRGVPEAWITNGSHIAVDNLTTSYAMDTGTRATYGVSIDTSGPATANVVTVALTGAIPSGDVRIQLPSLTTRGVTSVTGGTYDAATGTVSLAAGSTTAQIVLGSGAAPTVASTVAGVGANGNTVTDGQTVPATVTVTNNSTAAITGTLKPHVPTGWTVTPPSTDLGSIAAGATKTVTVSLTAPSSGTSRADIGFDVTWSGAAGSGGTIRSSADTLAQPPLPVPNGTVNVATSAVASASYTSPWENVAGVNDGIYPQQSNDQTKKRWGTWPQAGTQWVELDWAKPITTTGSGVYFLDDGGGVQVPSTWKVQYWNGTDWADVTSPSTYGTAKATFNQVTFDSVTTSKLRLVLTAGAGCLGVQEWIVDSPSSSSTTGPVTTASTTPAPNGANGWWTSGPVSIALAATDSDSTAKVSTTFAVDGAAAGPYTGPITISADGNHTVTYQSTDSDGNTEALKTLNVGIDSVAPTLTVTGLPADGTTSPGPVTATVRAVDQTSGVATTEYQLDGGGWTSYTAPITVSSSGQHVLQTRATDVAGNVSPVTSNTFTIAAPVTPATVTLTSATQPTAGAVGWYRSPVTVAIAAPQGSGLTVQYSLDFGAWKNAGKPFTVTRNAMHVVQTQLVDANRQPVTGSATQNVFGIDTVAPSATISAPVGLRGTPRNPVTLQWYSYDSLSGVAGMTVAIDGAAATSVVEGGSTQIATVGRHTVVLTATDAAGNVKVSTTTVTITADPATTITAPKTMTRGSFSTIQVAGFNRYEQVTITSGTVVVGQVTTDSSGRASLTISVPAALPSGPQTLTAVGGTSGLKAVSKTINVA